MTLVSRCGTTLVELIAALALVGIVMVGGMMLLDQLGDSAARIARDGARGTHEGTGARLLDRLLLDATASTDTTKRFRGDENSVEFSTWCDVPGGWMEACRAELAIDRRGDSSVVQAALSTGESFSILRIAGPAAFRYYNSSSPTDSLWVTAWSSNVTLPTAVGLILRSDTVVYPAGAIR